VRIIQENGLAPGLANILAVSMYQKARRETAGKTILRVLVPRGEDPPYVVDDYKIYVRAESETSQAVRDEIVSLVGRGKSDSYRKEASKPAEEALPASQDTSKLDETIGRTLIQAKTKRKRLARTAHTYISPVTRAKYFCKGVNNAR